LSSYLIFDIDAYVRLKLLHLHCFRLWS